MKPDRLIVPLMGLNRSGGVRVILSLLNVMAARGVDVHVYVPDYAARNEQLSDSITLHRVHTGVDTGGRHSTVRYLSRLIHELRRERGLFLATSFLTPLAIKISGMLSGNGAPMVYLIQSYEPRTMVKNERRSLLTRPVLWLLAQIGLRLSACRIAVSAHVSRSVRSRVDAVIHPGLFPEFQAVEAPGAQRTARSRPVIGMFASSYPGKGITGALEALSVCSDQFDVVLYRESEDGHDEVEHRARALSSASYPQCSHPVVCFYQDCDVFVFPSIEEGFGLPPLEAMACGTPVVLTDCGGPSDYAETGRNALVVPVGDGDALLSAVTRICNDAELRNTLISNGRSTASRFPMETFLDLWGNQLDTQLQGLPVRHKNS